MFEFKEITERAAWEDLVSALGPKTTFTQAWSWGELNASQGDRVERWGIFENQKLAGYYQALLVNARRGRFLFIPHGPVLQSWTAGLVEQTFEHLTRRAKALGASFIRVSPYLIDTLEHRQIFKQLKFRPAPIHMHAELTWVLDLNGTKDQLLRAMRKSTRYEISRIERSGVKVSAHQEPEIIKLVFWPLFKDTVKRHSFVPFSQEYLANELKIFSQHDEARVFVAWHNQVPLAAALVIFYNQSAYYHHGASASSALARRLPGAHAVQWAAINEARRRGLAQYNFWGIHPTNQPNHPWRGTTFFKQGFGGKAVPLFHAQDKPLKMSYAATYLFESLRRLKRHL